MKSMRCSIAPAHSTRGLLTPFVNAANSKGCSVCLTTQSDLEVTTIGGPDEATTTTAVTIDVTVVMTLAAMIGAVMSNNRRTAAMTMTYLLHKPQATPMGPSSRTRGRST
jgi:hypothetical protein